MIEQLNVYYEQNLISNSLNPFLFKVQIKSGRKVAVA